MLLICCFLLHVLAYCVLSNQAKNLAYKVASPEKDFTLFFLFYCCYLPHSFNITFVQYQLLFSKQMKDKLFIAGFISDFC